MSILDGDWRSMRAIAPAPNLCISSCAGMPPFGYRAPAPEVFVPTFAACAAAEPRPAPPATLLLEAKPAMH